MTLQLKRERYILYNLQQIFYSSGHTGIIYDCLKGTQTLLQAHVS
jgi:hypothetical protein